MEIIAIYLFVGLIVAVVILFIMMRKIQSVIDELVHELGGEVFWWIEMVHFNRYSKKNSELGEITEDYYQLKEFTLELLKEIEQLKAKRTSRRKARR